MRSVFAFALALAAPLILAAPAAAQDEAAWARFTSPNGEVSAELPCPADLVAKLAEMPHARLNLNVPVEQNARVMCIQNGRLFFAGRANYPMAAAAGKPIYDLLRDEVGARATEKIEVSDFKVDGRRAFANREVLGDNRAIAAIIEIDATAIVFISTGGSASGDGDIDAAIDRFIQSIRITAQ